MTEGLKEFLGMMIDESRTESMPLHSRYLVESHYKKEKETIQESMARAAKCWSSNPAHAQRLYDYASKGWFMWASPSYSNSVYEGEKVKNMPISCFLPYVPDDVPGLIFQKAEFSLLSVIGGGVGQFWGDVRPVSKKAPGPIPFIHENDGGVLAWKQGTTRRGALAAYLGIDHPDSAEFLKIRTPTGDSDRKSLNIHHGYNITDAFMEAVGRGDESFDLINPATGAKEGSVSPRDHFYETVITRARTGEPFMYFVDTAYKYLPLPQKVIGLRPKSTNLCTEITLAATRKRTPVCCLASVNAEKFREYEHCYKQMIDDLIEMLDNIIQFFVDHIDDIADGYEDQFDRDFMRMVLSKVKHSAERERSLGLGVMGWQYFLQSEGVPYESQEAADLDEMFFSKLKEYAHESSCRLGVERGVPPDIQEYIDLVKSRGEEPDPYWVNRRNLHLLALAPNANNSVILNTSASTEIEFSNVYSREMRIGTFEIRNKHLVALLKKKGLDTEEVWKKIITDGGSVKNIEQLTQRERDTFKTLEEIDQLEIVRRAAKRQKYICQAQSLNLYFPPGSDATKVVKTHYLAWLWGLKSLYYYRTDTDVKVERVNEKVEREAVESDDRTIVYGTATCVNCNAVKSLLKANNIEFEYIDLAKIGKTAAEVTGREVRTVPQVFLSGEYVGGLKEVQAFLAKKKESELPLDDGECLSCQG